MRNWSIAGPALGTLLAVSTTVQARIRETSRQSSTRPFRPLAGRRQITNPHGSPGSRKGNSAGWESPSISRASGPCNRPRIKSKVNILLDFNGMQISAHPSIRRHQRLGLEHGQRRRTWTRRRWPRARKKFTPSRIASLAELKDPKVKLSALGDSKVGDRAVAGTSVSSEGTRISTCISTRKRGC